MGGAAGGPGPRKRGQYQKQKPLADTSTEKQGGRRASFGAWKIEEPLKANDPDFTTSVILYQKTAHGFDEWVKERGPTKDYVEHWRKWESDQCSGYHILQRTRNLMRNAGNC